MKETKIQLNQRKIRNGKRKEFIMKYGSQKQILDMLTATTPRMA